MDLESIVERCQSGDRDAFEVIYRMYLLPMHEVVSYYVNSRDAVWDILHDGFIIAFQSIKSLKTPSKIKAWLTTIMKNLALQYLRDAASHISVPMSDAVIAEDYDNSSKATELTWEELDSLIGKLPEGYGKVFRLAVLEGLSHKEIGALLGIAPHSSSSQLTHAKAMLRSMIVKYRVDMGVLSIIVIALFLWHGINKLREESPRPRIIISIKTDGDTDTSVIHDTLDEVNVNPVKRIPKLTKQSKIITRQTCEPNEDVPIPDEGLPIVENDSVRNDSTERIITPTLGGLYFTEDELTKYRPHGKPDWSLSVACSGNLGQQEVDRYRIPNPYMPDGETLDNEIDVTETANHHMPLIIGIYVNRTFASRWSMETGIRYTLLRSDIHSESSVMNKETEQSIHYLGIPLKINYSLMSYNGFTLYGHGGGALDVPVFGNQQIHEYLPQTDITDNYTLRIKAPLQWSVEGGFGIQYRITPSLSIYAEPSFRYWFNSGSDVKTIHKDHPVEFSIPIGLRLSW